MMEGWGVELVFKDAEFQVRYSVIVTSDTFPSYTDSNVRLSNFEQPDQCWRFSSNFENCQKITAIDLELKSFYQK